VLSLFCEAGCGIYAFGLEVIDSSETGRPERDGQSTAAKEVQAAKVTFSYFDAANQHRVYWSHFRADGGLDLIGGKLESQDRGRISTTAGREVEEEVRLPTPWRRAMARQLTAYPCGHARQTVLKQARSQLERHSVSVWVVPLTAEEANEATPTLEPDGIREIATGTSRWRSASVLRENLRYADAFTRADEVVTSGQATIVRRRVAKWMRHVGPRSRW